MFFFSAYYLLGSQSFAILYLLCSIIVIVVHHNNSNKRPPRWLRKFISRLAKYLCIRLEHQEEEFAETNQKLPSRNKPNGRGIKDSQVSPATDALEKDKQSLTHSPLFQFFLHKEIVKREKKLIKAEWQWVASVLNSLFMVVALSLNFVSVLFFILAINDKI